MGTIIQKYGGTSVGSGERLKQVAAIIENTLRHNPVIAVVSAMSGTVKAEGTTSLLLQASDAAVRGRSFAEPLEKLRQHHLAAVDSAISTPRLEVELEAFVEEELARLTRFLEAVTVIRELSPRTQDIVLSVGERLSARLLAGVLMDRDVPALWHDLTYLVPDEEERVDPPFFRRMQQRLAELFTHDERQVPVVTGFFGLVPGGLLNAVGRGYTDFTAALISAGLGAERAEEMQVWKEVDGIFTADPRKVASARVLPTISPAEAAELTYFGSEVLHPFTMERVTNAAIPIRIKNTFNPDGAGTVIVPTPRPKDARPVTAVTSKGGVTIFTIQSNRMVNAYGFMAGVFRVLEAHGVVVDLISTSEVSVSCTVEDARAVERARPELEKLGQVTIVPNRAILAIVGEGMTTMPGIAGRMFSALGVSNVNVEMISQGSSEINISCVVRQEDIARGLEAVHQAFLGDQP